jgi:hypothetical protein
MRLTVHFDRFESGDAPFEGEVGRVQWCAERSRGMMGRQWRVRCVDIEQNEPENGVFATGEDACIGTSQSRRLP